LGLVTFATLFKSSLNPELKYEVEFSGLANGAHDFEWDLEAAFFEDRNSEEISDAKLNAALRMEKNDRMLNLAFSISGKVKTICDHCGDDVWLDLSFEEELIARFATKTDFSNDEVIFLGNSEFKLDVSQFLYEFTSLNLPSKRLHEPDECNPEVEHYFDDQEQVEEEEKEKDPRWKALEKLKN
jgi:uncharacterized protein